MFWKFRAKCFIFVKLSQWKWKSVEFSKCKERRRILKFFWSSIAIQLWSFDSLVHSAIDIWWFYLVFKCRQKVEKVFLVIQNSSFLAIVRRVKFYAMLGEGKPFLCFLWRHILSCPILSACQFASFEFLLLMLRGSSNILNETKPMPLAGLYEI